MDDTERDNTDILREGPTRGKFTVWPYQVGIVMRSGEVVDIFSQGAQRLPRGEVRTYIVSTAPFHLTFWLKDPGDADQPTEGIALDQPVLTADGQLVTGRIDLTLSVVPKNVEYLLQLLAPRGAIAAQEVADAIKWELLAKVLALDLHRHTAGDLRGNRELFKGIFESLQIELTSTIRRYGLRLDNFYVNWGLTPEEQEKIKEQRHRSIIRDIEREEELGGRQPNGDGSPEQPEDLPHTRSGKTSGVAVAVVILGALAAIGFAAFTMLRSDDSPQQDTPAPVVAALPTDTPVAAVAPQPTTQPAQSPPPPTDTPVAAVAPQPTSEPAQTAPPPTDTPTPEPTPQTMPAAARPTAPPTIANTATPAPPPPDAPTATRIPTPAPTASHTPVPTPTPTHTPTPAPTATATYTPTSTPIPDGRRIVFWSNRHGSGQIYVMNADGTNMTRLTSHLGDDYSPAWSPDGQRIVFWRGNDQEIYMMDADGSEVTQLTSGLRQNSYDPAWSPDGQMIAFQVSHSGWGPGGDSDGGVRIMSVDTTNRVSLTRPPGSRDYGPVWSPDGGRIVFWSNREKNADIYVVGRDGAGLARLTSHPERDYSPVWSPDGRRIAFVSERDAIAKIYVMDADGTDMGRLADYAESDYDPAWSPDGSRIVFVSERDGNAELYVVDADGANLTRLTDHSERDSGPVWSPYGDRIAFVSERDGNPEIYVIDADGSNLTRLTNHHAEDRSPAWAPGE